VTAIPVPGIPVPAGFPTAPELAQLAAPPALPGQAAPPAGRPLTAGRRAARLSALAAAPERWWDQVRFGAAGPAAIPVPGADGAWLLVLPPGAAARCGCGYATLIAGEAAEDGRPLRPGRVLLHGSGAGAGPHLVLGGEHGYSVSLHALSRTARAPPPAALACPPQV
jgi:hypothetical protein